MTADAYAVSAAMRSQTCSAKGRAQEAQQAEWSPTINLGIPVLIPEEYVADLSRVADTAVSVYPNAGLPNPLLPTGFPETPETLAPQLAQAHQLTQIRGKRLCLALQIRQNRADQQSRMQGLAHILGPDENGGRRLAPHALQRGQHLR